MSVRGLCRMNPGTGEPSTGFFIGDALAMPVHCDYDTAALRRDCGRVADYLAPDNLHPNSILSRSSYRPLNETE